MLKAFRSGRLLAVAVATYFAVGCGSTIFDQPPPESAGKAGNAPSELRLADVQLRVGRAAFDQGSLDTALELFEKAHKSAPNDARPLAGKGDVLFAQRRFAEAETAYRAAVARDPGSFEAQEGLGKTLVSNQKYQEGLGAFEAALAVRRDASLLNKIGVTHEMLGHGETAQKYYRDSLAIQSDNLTARNNLALSLGVSGSYDAALKEMEKVTASPKASERHHANLAFIYGLSGRSMDRVPPKVARAAAGKGWDDAFFARTREVAKSGDRTALLDLLNNPRKATPAPQFPPVAALPDMPDAEPEAAEKRDAAPAMASRQDDLPAAASAPAPAGGGPTALIPPAPPAPPAPEAATAPIEAATAAEAPEPAAEAPSEPTAEQQPAAPVDLAMQTPGPAAETPSAEQAVEQPAAPAQLAIQTPGPAAETPSEQSNEQPAAPVDLAMQTPGPDLADDPDTLGLTVPPVAAAPTAAAPDGAFRVELGAYRTTRWLSATLTRLGAEARDLVPENRLDVAYRKNMYLVRTAGLPTRDAAAKLCTDLRSRKFDCFVTGKRDRSSGQTFDIASAGDPAAISRFVADLPEIKAAMAAPAAPAGPDGASPAESAAPEAAADPAARAGTDMAHDTAPALPPAPKEIVAAVQPADPAPAGPAEAPAIVPPPPPPPSDVVAAIRRSATEQADGPAMPAASPPATAPPATGEPAAAGPESGEYRVQLAAYRLARHLERGMAVLKKAAGGLLPPLVGLTRAQTDTATAIPFRLRSAPLESRAAAEEVCKKLAEKGVECLVIRHGAGYWRPLA